MAGTRGGRGLSYRYVAGLLLALAIGLATPGFLRVLPALLAGPESYDFAAYYVAARATLQGLPLYDDVSMRQAAATATGALAYPRYIYPPFPAWLLQPLGWLSFEQARWIWLGVNVSALLIAIGALHVRFGLDRRFTLSLLVWIWLAPPVYDTLLLGQVSIVLMSLTAVAVTASTSGERRWSDLLAGICLGIAAAVKLYPALLVLPYLAVRRWRVVAAAGLTAAGASAVGLLSQGLAVTNAYITEVIPSVGAISPLPVSQSVWSVSLRLLAPTTFQYAFLSTGNLVTLSLQPVLAAPQLAALVPVCVCVLLWGTFLWYAWRRRAQTASMSTLLDLLSLAIVALLITSPVTHDHYLILLIIPLIYLWHEHRTADARTQHVILFGTLGAVLLIILQRYWRVLLNWFPSPMVTCFSFLALLVLWATLVYHISRRESVRAIEPSSRM